MKSDRERAVEQSQKKKRLHRACGELGHHDSRNCPGKSSDIVSKHFFLIF